MTRTWKQVTWIKCAAGTAGTALGLADSYIIQRIARNLHDVRRSSDMALVARLFVTHTEAQSWCHRNANWDHPLASEVEVEAIRNSRAAEEITDEQAAAHSEAIEVAAFNARQCSLFPEPEGVN